MMMPICPNCGSYVHEGEPVCQCGTQIGDGVTVEYDDEGVSSEMLERIAQNLHNEAIRLEKEGRYREAIEKCQRSLEMVYRIPTLEVIARLYHEIGDYEESLHYYNRLKTQKDYFRAYMGIGRQLAELGRYEEAFENFDIAMEKINGSSEDDETKWKWISWVYTEIGWAYYLQGDYDRAIENYEEGIGYCYDYSNNWNSKAIALECQGKYVEALKFYDIALSINPGDEIILENKEECLEIYGRAYLDGEYPVESEYLDEALNIVEEKSGFRREEHGTKESGYSILDFDEED